MLVRNLVIGSSPAALSLALDLGAKLVYKTSPTLMEFEDGYVDWKTQFILQCLNGNVVLHNRVISIMIDETNKAVKVRSQSFAEHTINYESLFIFDSSDVSFTSTDPISFETKNWTYDWYELTSVDEITTLEPISKLPKILGVWLHKNRIITKMALDDKEMNRIEYSDTYYKFMIQNALTDSGHRGRKNGFTSSGEQRFLNLEVSSVRRESLPKTKVLYPPIECVRFYYD